MPFFCDGNRIKNRIAAFFPKKSDQSIVSKYAKESTSIIAPENSPKALQFFVAISVGFSCFVVSHILGRSLRMFWHLLRDNHILRN